MDSKEVQLLKKALERQKKARKQAERILETKSKELYDVTYHLKQANNKLEGLLNVKTSSFEGAFINIIDPYIVMDLEFNVINMNVSAKEFLGYDHTKEDINLSKLVHKDYINYTAESIKVLMEVGILKNYRSKIVLKDGTEKFVEINSSIIYDKSKKPIAAQGIIRDISQENEIKQLLAEQRKQLDIIVQNSPLGIALTINSKIIKANPAFSLLLGYSNTELKSLEIIDLFKNKQDVTSLEFVRTLKSKETDNFSTINNFSKKNGKSILAKTNISTVRDNRGEVEFQVAIIEDITQQKILELQKEELLKDLENSNQELQEYAHIVSHDLKSPLRSISAITSWIKEDYYEMLDDNGKNNLSLLQDKVESMDKLISGILEYSTANSSDLKNTKVDLNKIVEEIKESIYIPKNVEVIIPKSLPTIKADGTKMYQLFQNIIGNAVVHIDKKNGLVEVIFKETEDFWQFSIKDNGVGIAEKYHKKIFEIFQSVGEKERSTGIGLSIVKKIVDRYDGKVWVDSKIGAGTNFHFTLKKLI
ncbi:PAS domain S-box protein [uncultured Croceitalea sp.]|uniref:PAS domain-containing sensor histidine kinase n=1 Tax=uncultured Croceitalea sp. TaxID=1798908 RepID=UPI003305AAF0